jgi:hypothetical protein
MSSIHDRLRSFVLERFPFALPMVERALDATSAPKHCSVEGIETFRAAFGSALAAHAVLNVTEIPDTTPGVDARTRSRRAVEELLDGCDGFLVREAIAASLTADERREMLRGMILTRAVDNRLKQFFSSGDVRYKDTPFQGKGFRSLGQEAIYAAGIRLKRGAAWRDTAHGWQGDVVGPLIRDLGVALAMRSDDDAIRMVLNAQMG